MRGRSDKKGGKRGCKVERLERILKRRKGLENCISNRPYFIETTYPLNPPTIKKTEVIE